MFVLHHNLFLNQTIIGVHYNPTADVWSFACMIFEMLTGDFLFEPRKGPNFSKNDDHIAQVMKNKILFIERNQSSQKRILGFKRANVFILKFIISTLLAYPLDPRAL